MKYDLEFLIHDLELPEEVLLEDLKTGRLPYVEEEGQTYVLADEFVYYIATRVIQLTKTHQKLFWMALKKLVVESKSPAKLSPQDIATVMVAIEHELAKLA